MRSCFVGFLTFALFPLSLSAAVSNRIATIQAGNSVSLHGNVSPRALAAQDLGEAPQGRMLESLTLHFGLSAAQQTALDQLLADQQNPESASYHQWLTPEQFGEQFGLSDSDVAKVTAWLTGQGFTVTGVGRSKTFVTFSGTVATAERAFQTSIHSLTENGEQHIGNVTEPQLPAGLASVTASISGLNDFKLRSRAQVRQVAPDAAEHPQYTSSVSGDHYIAPGDFYTIYDINPLLTSSVNGSGITIAVMGQTDISLSDVAAFRTAAGLAANVPTVKVYGSDPGTSKNDVTEAQLDVEWSGAVAPSATILYVNSTDVLGTSLVQAIDNDVAPIITVSYGDCESGFGSTGLNAYNQLFAQANAEGITIMGPGGDSGATDCDYNVSVATGGLAVDFPASSPFVTGVGGSMFNEGSGSYWNTTNGTYAGSAISYIPEAVWNETASAGATELSAGGGGASKFFTKPTWQTGTGVPNDSSRDVPDLALNAAYLHDGYLFCAQGFCTNGFRDAQGYLDEVGGTSVGTPSFAGMVALLEQKLGGTRLGNINAKLYALANSTYYNNVFHDITVGNNDSPCRTGSPNCANGGSIGYNATTGYDQASGWGSVDGYNLVNDWNLVGTGGGSTTGTAVSTTTLSLAIGTTTQCGAVTGSTYNFTVTVTGTAGTPTGSVQFLVDNVAVGSAVMLSGGTATYTLSTTGLSSGSHVVTAAYSGDTTYASSKGSYTVDLTSATAGDFSLTPCTTSVTATAGQAAPGITYTVTSLNSFSGPVNFSVSTGSASLAASYSFSVSPVTLTSNGTATTVLTLYAYEKTTNAAITPISTAEKRPGDAPWLAAGGGMMMAGLLLMMAPRRRRWPMLLAVLLTVGALGFSGCSTQTATSSSTTTTSTTTNASPGTYPLTVTASGTNSSGTNLVHNVTISLTVQ